MEGDVDAGTEGAVVSVVVVEDISTKLFECESRIHFFMKNQKNASPTAM